MTDTSLSMNTEQCFDLDQKKERSNPGHMSVLRAHYPYVIK